MSHDVIGEGNFLRLVRKGHYEFVERTRVNGVVVIVPETAEGELLFIEQFRPPVDSNCIEFPAGLSGDLAEASDEELINAARRELMEETGYEASDWKVLGTAAPTGGLTSETHTFFHASGMKKTGTGGGVENEKITSHLIPRDQVRSWLETQAKRAVIGSMVYCGLYLAGKV